jgi:hypothetical protein
MSLFTAGSVWSVKGFTTGLRNMANVSLMTKRLKRKWLRQQSKDFPAAGLDALVKQWDKCISVSGGYVEK